MNKADLVEKIAINADVSKASAGRMLDVALQSIMDAVADGDQVALTGFGTFKSQARPARLESSPRNRGEKRGLSDQATLRFFIPTRTSSQSTPDNSPGGMRMLV